jgi:hypothetical protein
MFHILELKESIEKNRLNSIINKKEVIMNKENIKQLQKVESIPLKH